ncbi:hypothetical protein K438DRAFT_1940473 [Mycena galopus ATCC 62051]|nr:hypothetical protein K438DRAFT_1940473 [Mycena galopus ATCC 62051]
MVEKQARKTKISKWDKSGVPRAKTAETKRTDADFYFFAQHKEQEYRMTITTRMKNVWRRRPTLAKWRENGERRPKKLEQWDHDPSQGLRFDPPGSIAKRRASFSTLMTVPSLLSQLARYCGAACCELSVPLHATMLRFVPLNATPEIQGEICAPEASDLRETATQTMPP